MRVTTATAILATVLLAAAIPARADTDTPGADWMPQDQVTKKLEAAGYTNITGLQADDGHWEGKGVKNGQITEFHVDPHSGAISNEEVDKD
jgi:hypothetical protein